METLTFIPPTPWETGENRRGDEALNKALLALKRGQARQCLAHLHRAMRYYGWKYHSDRKARRLWKVWNDVADIARRDPVRFARAADSPNYVELYHEVYRSVHLAKDGRIRRNLPP